MPRLRFDTIVALDATWQYAREMSRGCAASLRLRLPFHGVGGERRVGLGRDARAAFRAEREKLNNSHTAFREAAD
eukprot:5020174-Pyramimonas_sp.AAC.1